MDDTLNPVAHANGGYLFRHQLNALGLTDKHIVALRRSGHLVRLRHGTYTTRGIWRSASAIERYVIAVRSVLDRLGPAVAASHVSAAVLNGLDVWDVDLAVVHVTRLDGATGRTEAGVVHHENSVDFGDDVTLVDDRQVMVPARAALETAAIVSVESGMVTISSVLRSGVTAEELREAQDRFARWPGFSRVQLGVRLADGRLETVGEVRSLHLMWQFQIPYPELQHELVIAGGRIVRSDFYWELFRHVGEFDGLLKYGRLNPFTADPGQRIVEEKIREDAIRELSLGVSRWVWDGLAAENRERTAGMIRKGMERSRRLYTRGATHLT